MNPDIISAARKGAIYGIIISFSAAAVVGIVALLGGDFGETQGKILLTTVLFGAASITALCHLAIADRSMRIVAAAGLLASLAALVPGMVLIWRDWNLPDLDTWLQAFGVAGILAVSLAHANLLLLLAGRRRRPIRIGLAATLVAIGIVAILLILPIVTEGDIPGDDGDLYWRVFGVIAILDVLGTVVVPVLAIFVRDEPRQPVPQVSGRASLHGADDDPNALVLTVPGTIAELLQARAIASGVPVEVVAIELLRQGASVGADDADR
ncbi:hypothetical protein [Microcella alkaliphila]|uniref:Uncharacterized protein n=1 Tax=Microcella alkaliphila TaxID=279828 RepID=A0A0U4NXH3_9MICO|nr:hypothetical protein [Microcella alkaliphila]BAU32915.1 uncharacterized protein MalAC0309_2070 [Microcella alkaliphila]